MPLVYPHQTLDSTRTSWHITFGTYGARLHGDDRPTVDKQYNQPGEDFVAASPRRKQFEREKMKFPPRYFTLEQRKFVEVQLPAICVRGGWSYRICAGGADHVHLLCDIRKEIHGEKVRRLVKRWVGQALSERWPLKQGESWWADEGSNIAIHDNSYLNNAFAYIARQRATLFEE
ncbi:hypothetical protein [Bythopirellula goksoeyrii]|uniref:hypothetical protein n=1 Tax=Bythopirellula goksoeyrii TaxID=1400387 RepID=UPI0011CDC5C8|nr:hypothetical protein [Bythopirellula goksoeyrii]